MKAECWRIDFELWCWRRLLRVPWTARRTNQSILKEISPGCSLEGLMLKLQYFGHFMQRVDSLEKSLMLGGIRGRRRREQQRMRWLDGITDSMDMSLSELRSWWWTGRPGVLQFMGTQRVGHDWATELNWTELWFLLHSHSLCVAACYISDSLPKLQIASFSLHVEFKSQASTPLISPDLKVLRQQWDFRILTGVRSLWFHFFKDLLSYQIRSVAFLYHLLNICISQSLFLAFSLLPYTPVGYLINLSFKIHLYGNCWTNISAVLFGSILSSLKHVNLLCLWNSSGNRVEEAVWDISQGSEHATSIFSVYLHPPSETNLCE